MAPRPRQVLRTSGWLVAIGGFLASVAFFWIDHMNTSLWRDMVLGIAISVTVGATLIRFGKS